MPTYRKPARISRMAQTLQMGFDGCTRELTPWPLLLARWTVYQPSTRSNRCFSNVWEHFLWHQKTSRYQNVSLFALFRASRQLYIPKSSLFGIPCRRKNPRLKPVPICFEGTLFEGTLPLYFEVTFEGTFSQPNIKWIPKMQSWKWWSDGYVVPSEGYNWLVWFILSRILFLCHLFR